MPKARILGRYKVAKDANLYIHLSDSDTINFGLEVKPEDAHATEWRRFPLGKDEAELIARIAALPEGQTPASETLAAYKKMNS